MRRGERGARTRVALCGSEATLGAQRIEWNPHNEGPCPSAHMRAARLKRQPGARVKAGRRRRPKCKAEAVSGRLGRRVPVPVASEWPGARVEAGRRRLNR